MSEICSQKPYDESNGRGSIEDKSTSAMPCKNGVDVEADAHSKVDSSEEFRPGIRFWAVLLALGVASFQASLENSVVTTSGPAIVADLNMGEEYIWVTNAFFVTCAAFQPLFGQLCNAFGRRSLMLFVTALFTLGSGICGGASSGSMLIAGRAVQGAGSGGVVMLVHIILADLVPLRQRGYYLAFTLTMYGVGLTVGPLIGGAFADNLTWRWGFYINLPFGGAALGLLWVFLRVKYNKDASIADKLRSIDWVGNALIMAGSVSMLYALANAGTKYSWSSWHTLIPLLVGFLVVVCFGLWESYSYILVPAWNFEPVMPPRLFHHRTSLIVAINTFLHWMLVYWAMYFIPLWFEAVFLYSAETAGVDMLPMSLVAVPGSAIAAAVVSRWGRFKWLHVVGELIFTVCMGLFALQWVQTPTAVWASILSICALGGGIILDTLLPAFQAPVSEADQAVATATWAFIRTMGGVWGVAIPSTIFNNRISQLVYTISDVGVRELLSDGGGYAHADADFIKSYPQPVRAEIQNVYREALQLVFLTSVAFGGAACVLFLFEKDVTLRKSLETDFGLVENDSEKKEQVHAVA